MAMKNKNLATFGGPPSSFLGVAHILIAQAPNEN
jgi:hypothetical protein